MNFHKVLYLLMFFQVTLAAQPQAELGGTVTTVTRDAVVYANVALYHAKDSSLVSVELSDDEGSFRFSLLSPGAYFLGVSYLGFQPFWSDTFVLRGEDALNLNPVRLTPLEVALETATVSARRSLLEVKTDRVVFNVSGTINASGNDAIQLLRMAPGVTVDNNNNVSVLGRSGVLFYVDGKRLPLEGNELTAYLRSLTAEQIDRVEIISNPGARYEAEGNAGIIDIILKKFQRDGANGSFSSSVSKGEFWQYNHVLTGNWRRSGWNVFGSLGYNYHAGYNENFSLNDQNNLLLDEFSRLTWASRSPSARLGIDYWFGEVHTLGVYFSGLYKTSDNFGRSDVDIYPVNAFPGMPDSLLRATTFSDLVLTQSTYNLNYLFQPRTGGRLNLDLDYGRFTMDVDQRQPNTYLGPDGGSVFSETNNSFSLPVNVSIYTAKVDYEKTVGTGRISTGLKWTDVATDNTFLFFEEINGSEFFNDRRSNQFTYDESVWAAYVSYDGRVSDKVNYTLGLRAEMTDAIGILEAFRIDLQEDPVTFDYVSFFPSAGVTYAVNEKNLLSLNAGRRINRPNYNVLNPFRTQLSQLSYERGNPFLQPEIVANVDLGYTFDQRFNFKLAYGLTVNQITRLVQPDEQDPRAVFTSWENLATRRIWSLNASLPFSIGKRFTFYVNAAGSHLDNQAVYPGNAIVDVRAWSYTLFAQSTAQVPGEITLEISGFLNGPGVWGGVFRHDATGSLNLGMQRKFFGDRMNVKLSVNDLLFTAGWRGVSVFNGLSSEASGYYDSRRVGISLNYSVGNDSIKRRNRRTGIEDESRRVGGG